MGDETGPDYRGELRKYVSFEVCCGVCERFDEAPYRTAALAAGWLRALGWRLTKYDGWVCPDCLRQSAAALA